MDELDRRLTHALQLAPRAPWTALAPIVGADAVTLARRWDRMIAAGTVYVTPVSAEADDLVFAFVELSCPPRATQAVVAALVQDPAVTTLDRTTGDRTLIATVAARTVPALAEWSATVLAAVEGLDSARTLLVTGLVADARAWRIRALSARETAAVQATMPAPTTAHRTRPEHRRALIAALVGDIRRPVSELASRTGLSARVVRDQLTAMLSTGELTVRVDVARDATDWPLNVWFFLRTPPDSLDRVTQRLSRLPEQRVVATTAGRYSVVLATWLRSADEVHRLEAALDHALPQVRIVDRSVVLRTEKHVGHLLDARGYATGAQIPFVPASAGDLTG